MRQKPIATIATNYSGLDLTVQFVEATNLAYANITGIQAHYLHTGEEIAIEYSVTTADGKSLIAVQDYEAVIKNSSDVQVETVKELDNYTLTINGKGSYSGSQTIEFSVAEIAANLPAGDYTVTQNITINERIEVNGDVLQFWRDKHPRRQNHCRKSC